MAQRFPGFVYQKLAPSVSLKPPACVALSSLSFSPQAPLSAQLSNPLCRIWAQPKPQGEGQMLPRPQFPPQFPVTVVGRGAGAMHRMLLNKLICYSSILSQAWPCPHHGPKGCWPAGGPGASPLLLVIHLVFEQTFTKYLLWATTVAMKQSRNSEGLVPKEEPTG